MIKLLDFYADWCKPCQMISPILNDIINENSDIELQKINVDHDDTGLTAKYNIVSIPTIFILKDGEIRDKIIGALPKSKILEIINKYKD